MVALVQGWCMILVLLDTAEGVAGHDGYGRNQERPVMTASWYAAQCAKQRMGSAGCVDAHVCERVCDDHAARRERRSQRREQTPPRVESLQMVHG